MSKHTAFYEVSVDASTKEIEKAYRKLSRKYHPDRNSEVSAKEKFQRLTFIRSTLIDPSKRSHYDRFGELDLDEADDIDGPEAEEGSDEDEGLDPEAFGELLKKFGAKNVPNFEKFMKQSSYTSRPGPWTEETATEEWSQANEAEVTQLEWGRKYLTSLPDELFSAEDSATSSLQTLVLDTNKLTQLPSSLQNLESLETLDLSSNDFTEFPSVILSLKNLKVLKMERNKLKSIPTDLHTLTHLEHVSFFGNQIEDIDDECFRDMKALRKVDLELNFISQIPQSLLDLQSTTEDFILTTDDLSRAPPKKKATRKKPTSKPPSKKRPRRASTEKPATKRQRKK